MKQYKFAAPILERMDPKFEQLLGSQQRPIVFTNGCFDILHSGHVRLLNLAGVFGFLVVGLNSDASVKKLKGEGRPVNKFEDRALALASIRAVQAVVMFDEPRCERLIRAVKPAIYVKGGDYTVETLDKAEREALESAGAEIMLYPTVPGLSTTSVIEKIK